MILNATKKEFSTSLWMDTVKMPHFPQLEDNIHADVCVIGGGIAGLTTAYLLAKSGERVCVLEDLYIGTGQTGQTTAHFTTALDDRYFQLEKLHGRQQATLAAHSHLHALRKVEEIVKQEDIECDFEKMDGYLFRGPQQNVELIFKEADAVFNQGVLKTRIIPRAPIDSFDTGTTLKFPDQITLHPLKYIRGLARGIVRYGGQIFENTHVTKISDGITAQVHTRNNYTVKAESVVVATNSPIHTLFSIHTKQAPYRTYVVGLLVPRYSVEKALYWDTEDPYHYIRVKNFDSTNDILIVGGEDHKTGQDDEPENRYFKLVEWASERFPVSKVAYHWSGQVMEPVDSLGFMGRTPGHSNIFLISGDSGNGMTHTTIGGMLIRDLITGVDNPWESLYDPSRISLKATKDFVSENANVALQYADWLGYHSAQAIRDLPYGSGTIISKGLRKIAVYRDETGGCNFMSAKCPHLNGVVHWNSAEKSWDCPCHGSRFDRYGSVIEGPSVSDLATIHIRTEPVIKKIKRTQKLIRKERAIV
jgi:glycine/D-amino acid oxidase-like deaminating enzyme/nitrite reductase/ring-hydroxylating ferredoxin subunit